MVSVAVAPGGAGGASRPQVSDIGLGKKSDDCSVSLYNLIFTGRIVRSVVISMRGAGNREALRLTLSDVLVSSITETAAGEKATLFYSRIEIFDPQTGQRATYDRRPGGA